MSLLLLDRNVYTQLTQEREYLMIHLDNERDCVVPDLCVDLTPHVPITFMSARIIVLDRFLRHKLVFIFHISNKIFGRLTLFFLPALIVNQLSKASKMVKRNKLKREHLSSIFLLAALLTSLTQLPSLYNRR